MPNNPYEKHTISQLKEIEKRLLNYTRDPKVPGHKRRVALRDLGQVRAAMKTK